MSDSVRPHRRQPTRLRRPWDSLGKNTGVGCHFLLQCMKVKSESEIAVVSDSSRPHGLQPTRLLHAWDFPGKSTGVGCHCLLRLFVYICVYIHIYTYICASHSVMSNSFVTPWTVTCLASLSMEFSRQKKWSGLAFLFPDTYIHPGIKLHMII